MQNELIIVSEYCDKCHIEPSFIEDRKSVV